MKCGDLHSLLKCCKTNICIDILSRVQFPTRFNVLGGDRSNLILSMQIELIAAKESTLHCGIAVTISSSVLRREKVMKWSGEENFGKI